MDPTLSELPPTPRVSDPAEGDVLASRYRILGKLGEGGMGTVHQARDLELDEVVAIKMLRPDLLDAPDALERFRREVKLARRVTHRSVARTFDIGEHAGARFLSMEFVAGESLARRLGRAPPPSLREILEIGIAICEGLDAAHAAGVVHRDLKPENVMLGSDGRVVIMDFGIARALEGEATRATGSPIGTPAYMAPEQLQGRTDIDGRADLYALGVILFEACTGRAPFRGDSAYALAAARLTENAPDPQSVRQDLPASYAALIRTCLAKEPKARFPTARALADALRAARNDIREDVRQGTLLSIAPATPPPTPNRSGPRSIPISPSAPFSTTPAGTKTVAVLPFASEEAEAYLADGLTEDLIDQLTMTPGLRVRPRSAVHRMRSPDRDAQALGRDLGVQFVVDGSMRRRGEMLRVNARIVSVADGFQTWAKRFDVADIAAVLDEMAAAVGEALTVPVAIQARRLPTGPVALDLYFRARHEYHRLDAIGVLRAVELFDRALEHAPDDPMVLTGAALARVRQWFFGGIGSGEQAEHAAERAVQVAPDRAEPYVALAAVRFQQGRGVEAVRAVRDALKKSPALADAHELLGRILSETGPTDLALGHLQTAARLDPTLHHALWTTARLHALSGRWDEAEAIVDRTAKEAGTPGGWLYVARLAVWRGDLERASRILAEPAMQKSDNETALRLVRSVVEGSLDVDGLFDPTMGGRHSSGRSAAFFHQVRAELLSRADRIDAAAESLSKSAAAGLVDAVWMDRCPLLSKLRNLPAFAEARRTVENRAAEIRAALG
ncbi:MAG: protein kinase domain-containing protein [Polyangiales bacterium]